MTVYVNVWWSKAGEVLVSMDPETARRYEGALEMRRATGFIPDLVERQVEDGLKAALREAPPGT